MTKVSRKHPEPSGNEVQAQRVKSRQDLSHDELGREIPDPRPLAPPLNYKRSPTIAEQMRSMILSEKLKQEALAAGAETFEEADDFDVGDDFDPTSPYEEVFEPLPSPIEEYQPFARQLADELYNRFNPAPAPAAAGTPAAGPPGARGDAPTPGVTSPQAPPGPDELPRGLFRR